ncbi:hypothetical protein [Hymenobacter sp. BT190]|uniref:hypothetical protein n=1 Tax=Hymenobacter sp. BT190 TaxID=2763505 RepID=UPI00165189E4|nr:hypothetical protein [Hymenobacter sp. BT190]MBC6699115.1 hypothetical protein [Hymenobacter sp. BT190]
MNHFSSSYLTIDYLVAPRVLAGRWWRGVMPFELHRGYAALLDAAVSRRCRFWLVDLSNRAGGVDAADVQWILSDFFPQLPVRLKRPVYLAYLMAPHQLAGVLANPAIPALSYFDDRPYHLERFTTEESALTWLEQCRKQDARSRRKPIVQ